MSRFTLSSSDHIEDHRLLRKLRGHVERALNNRGAKRRHRRLTLDVEHVQEAVAVGTYEPDRDDRIRDRDHGHSDGHVRGDGSVLDTQRSGGDHDHGRNDAHKWGDCLEGTLDSPVACLLIVEEAKLASKILPERRALD